ncbi:MAG: ankyrin repeat domain-containing protein [Alphaproteobacteria bacterium]|nr:ankyrin repeat domain-containing protein [Alphaproteobacteria bacterium]
MKRLLFGFTSIFFISHSSFANVPLEECFDLYHNTKEEYKGISPAWAEIMLQSGHLKGIRFFGDFSSKENPEFKPHPAFNIEADTLKLNAPQDAISALLEYLFPSPNGQVLAINQRQNDPLGQLSKKHNLPLVNNLVKAIYYYKTNPDILKQMLIDELTFVHQEEIKKSIREETNKELKKYIKENRGPKSAKIAYDAMSNQEKEKIAEENHRYKTQIENEEKKIKEKITKKHSFEIDKIFEQEIKKKDKKILLKELIGMFIEKTRSNNDKTKKTQKIFDPIRDQFVDVLLKAVNFEDEPACQQKYPPNLVINSLFGFALISADKIEEIYDTFKWMFIDQPETRIFSKDDYERLVSQISKNPKFENNIEIDDSIRALFGQVYFEQILPKPLTYTNTSYIHNSKRIPYPNCGETSLLNFFYYLWGDRGVINPTYIKSTEKKLMGPTNDNWQKLKDYFLEFNVMSASASHIAQEKWSNLISNMNQDDTHPTLKIIYRQKVCNVQGIGIINMLNVLEKIMPDTILSQPFADNELDVLELASTKLDRLSYLFSRPEDLITWQVNGEKKVTKKVIDVVFSINEEERFTWEFKDNSFDLEPIQNKKNDWRKNCDWKKAPLIIKAWVHSDIQSLNYLIEHPSEIYALNLLSPVYAAIAVDKILAHKWVHMKSIVPQIIGKSLFVDDTVAQKGIYTLLHFNNGIIGEIYYPEFDWKTYIPEFKPMTQRSTLQLAAFMNCWDVVQNFSIEDNIEARTHVIATDSGCLPIVKWILDQNPKAIHDTDPGNRDLIQIAIEEGHFDVLDYLLSILNEPLSYRTENGQTLFHLYAQSSHDMTSYVADLLQKGMKLDVVDNQQSTALHTINPRSHFNNIKFLIDKMVQASLILDQQNFQNETPLIHIACNGPSEAFFYLLDKGASIEYKGWQGENLLHKIANSQNKLDIIRFLVEQKGFDIHQTDNQGSTVLHYAAQSGFMPNIQYLLEKGAKTDVQNKTGQTPLHILLGCMTYNIDGLLTSTKLLLDNGADLNAPDANGSTPFGSAFAKHDMSLDLIRGLIKLGGIFPDFSQKTDDLLHNACKSSQLELVKFLVEECLHPIDGTDQHGQSPLHIAVDNLNFKIVNYLLSKSADPHALNNMAQTPLHMLSITGHAFYRSSNNWDFDEEDDEDEDEQYLDSNEQKALILKNLLEHGSQIDETDATGKTTLLLVIPNIHGHGVIEFIEMLIENGADLFAIDNEGNNVLHCFFGCSSGCFNPNDPYDPKSYLKHLLAKGFDLESKNSKGETPLFYAIRNASLDPRNIQKIEALLDLGADVNTMDNDGHSILDIMPPHILTQPEALIFIERIIENGLDQKACDKFFASGLQKSLNTKTYDNATGKWVLSLESIKYFISKGASLHQKDENNKSLFALFINALGSDDLTALFTETGLDINSPDEEGNTFLHQLAASGNFNHLNQDKILKMLDLGADINKQNLKGETPFLIALKSNNYFFLDAQNFVFMNVLKFRGLDLSLADIEGNKVPAIFIPSVNSLNDLNIQAYSYFLENGLFANQKDKDEKND